MATDAEILAILLRLQGARAFIADARASAASVRDIGKASEEAGAKNDIAGSKFAKSGGMVGLLKKSVMGLGAGFAAAAFEGVKMSISFDKQMEMLHTQAGVSQSAIKGLSNQVLDLARHTSQGPEELAKGLYHLASIGMKPVDAMKALKVAADGAAVGNANLEDTTTALGSAWLSGIKGAGDFRHVMALANATVGAGNMRMQDLVHSLGTGVLPSAKIAGLGIKDVFGALALLSDEGYKGSSAMAQLATALHFLYNPGKKAETALEAVHLSGTKLYNLMSKRGLPAALQALRDNLAKFGGSKAQQAQLLGDVVPGGRGRVLVTLMNQIDRYHMKLNQINKTSGQFAEDVARTHQTASWKIRNAWSNIEVDLIKLGHILQPIAVTAIVVISKVINWLLKIPGAIKAAYTWFEKLPFPIKAIVYIIGLMIAQGLALFAAYKIWQGLLVIFNMVKLGILAVRIAILLLTTGSGPLMLALMALVAVGILIATHWKAVSKALVAAWDWIKRAFMNAVHFIVNFLKHNWPLVIAGILGPFGIAVMFIALHWDAVKKIFWDVVHAIWNFLKKNWPLVLAVITGPIGLLVYFVVNHFNQIVDFIKSIPGKIAKVATGMWDGIKDAFRDVINWIIDAWNSLHFHVPGVSIFGQHIAGFDLGVPKLPHLAEGGLVTQSGAALVGERGPEILDLPRGARVTPLPTPFESDAMTNRQRAQAIPLRNDALARQFTPTIISKVYLNGREIAEAQGQYIQTKMARA